MQITPTKDFDPGDLVARLKQQEWQAFGELCDRYGPTLFGVSCKILQNETVAEDLLQEVFIKIWKNLDQYDPARGSFFTWLLNITRYTAIDYLRSRSHRQQLKNQMLPDNEYYYGDSLTTRQPEYQGLVPVVQKLDSKYREVIELVYLRGHTQQEVAELLDLPLGTVKTRTRMALQIIKKELSHGGD